MTFRLLAVFSLLLMTACNTVEGAGQDMSSAGHAVSNQAAQTKSQM